MTITANTPFTALRDRLRYQFDALATADALKLLQAASVASSHVDSVQRMTYNARDRFNAETRAYFRQP